MEKMGMGADPEELKRKEGELKTGDEKGETDFEEQAEAYQETVEPLLRAKADIGRIYENEDLSQEEKDERIGALEAKALEVVTEEIRNATNEEELIGPGGIQERIIEFRFGRLNEDATEEDVLEKLEEKLRELKNS